MELGIQPGFQLIANNTDVTAIIKERFISLRLVEETGGVSDTLEVELDDTNPNVPIAVPPVGAQLQVSLGYDGNVTPRGMFVADEVEMTGWPARMIIRARAAPYTQTPSGMEDLQTQKTRSWARGTTIGAMVAKMASEHGMTPAVSASLSSIELPQTDQTDESDMNVLLRLAKRYDAVAKPAAGNLIFAQRGTGQTVSGLTLPSITIQPSDTDSYNATQTVREAPGTVVTSWYDIRNGQRHEVGVGTGNPVKRIRGGYPDQATAIAAAKAELTRRARKQNHLRVAMQGSPDLTAECMLVLAGFRDGVAGTWLVSSIEHILTKEGGYVCDIQADRPNSDPAVKSAINGNVYDTIITSPSYQ
jgi:phage protein D